MIAAILIWVYVLFITLSYGLASIRLLRYYLKLQEDIDLQLATLVLLGLTIVAWLSSSLYAFINIGLLAHILILVGALACLSFVYKEIILIIKSAFQGGYWALWLLVVLAFISVILYAIKFPLNPDTYLYHAQAIHWIETYPVIPGLGNLDPRLGANSNWFILNALFSLSFLNLQSFHLIPSFLFLTCFFYFLNGLQSMLEGDVRFTQILKMGFIPFAFYILKGEISSPGTDLPVILFYWATLCLWVETIETDRPSRLKQIAVVILSMTALTYKLSGTPIILIGLYVLISWMKQREYRLVFASIGIISLLLLPWLIGNFILSGYWLYPVPFMGFLSPHVDWRVPIDQVIAFKQGVQAWAISPRLTWENVAALSFQSRWTIWFSNLTFNQKGLFIFAICSPLLFGLFSLVLASRKLISDYWPVILIGYINLLFWLLIAQNLRFGYGFVAGMFLLAFLPLIQFVFKKLQKRSYYLVVAIILALSVQQIYIIALSAQDDTQYMNYLVLPAPYRHVSTEPCNIGDVTIYCAQSWRQCGYDAFPCAVHPLNKTELRGSALREGFIAIISK